MDCFRDRMDQLVKRFEMLEAQMLEPFPPEIHVKMAEEYRSLEEVVCKIRGLQTAEKEQGDLLLMLHDELCSPDLRTLISDDLSRLSRQMDLLHHELRLCLLPRDLADKKNVILEIRAGTGGQEAALFCGDLHRMYERYAALKRWNFEVVSFNESETGGFKEILSSVSGQGVFARLKFESGVHRVQRVPETESAGRIHTSAATVAVLPEAESVDIDISEQDIRIDTMRAAGAGGQHVNTTDSAVRITHLPTGLIVVQSRKSQHQNRAKAMQILRARLFDLERSRLAQERADLRRLQVGCGDRSGRIRTYNFPQGRVTDHRVNLTLHKLGRILEGDLDELIDVLMENHQAQLLSEMTSHA